jgi:hypothetical protein
MSTEAVFRCDHCGQTTPSPRLYGLDGAICSVACYMHASQTSSEEECLKTHGGSHPSTFEAFWFKDPGGQDHFHTKCTSCLSMVGASSLHPERSTCPSRHAPMMARVRGDLGGLSGRLQASDSPQRWTCDDCHSTFSRAEVKRLLLVP